VRITELEKQVLLAIIKNEYQPITNGDTVDIDAEDVVDQEIWYLIHTDMKHVAGFENPKTLSGVMSSLVKKGLAGTLEDGPDSTCWITAEGYEAFKEFIFI
jgi:hypothetical protein